MWAGFSINNKKMVSGNKRKRTPKNGTRKKRKKKITPFVKSNVESIIHRQQNIVKFLRSIGLTVEGRIFNYLKKNQAEKCLKFGNIKGLPDIEIYDSYGTFSKCAIYFGKKNAKISKILESNGYNIIVLPKKCCEDIFIIKQKYLNLKKSKVIVNSTTKFNPGDVTESRMINNTFSEREFHTQVITHFRENYPHLLLEGRIQGNLREELIAFSNRMGYIISSSDLSVKHPSPLGYKQLDIELKIWNGSLRKEQRDRLLFLSRKFDHCCCCVVGEPTILDGIKKIEKILDIYFNGTREEMEEYIIK